MFANNTWKGVGVALSEVVFPASLLIFITVFTIAYAAIGTEKSPAPVVAVIAFSTRG